MFLTKVLIVISEEGIFEALFDIFSIAVLFFVFGYLLGDKKTGEHIKDAFTDLNGLSEDEYHNVLEKYNERQKAKKIIFKQKERENETEEEFDERIEKRVKDLYDDKISYKYIKE
ncbi:hypothetical protein N9906_03700 [Flavobacteriaceae bacterium]|jgi:hypothetical protein|nr:hypothetical protein [Flavobacteriaceae bacterium]